MHEGKILIAYSICGNIIDIFSETGKKLIINDFEKEDEIIELIGSLKYEIIKEMVLIHNTGENDLLFIEMKDGNYVKIYMSQFEQKMPYYLQIKQIIKSQSKKSKGILHLDRGDYYEPK